MLAYGFFVKRRPNEEFLARWRADYESIEWLNDLDKKSLVKNLGGDGYPYRYEISAGTIQPILAAGPPADHLFHGTYIDHETLNSLDTSEVLDIEVWDQS